VVIYDPEGGFVTGGGWFVDSETSEKAHFNFNPKYHKNASAPKGKADLKLGDMKFESTSLDWLVVDGSRAFLKGTGTISGMGEYGFMLSAIDGTPDRFRTKIWDKATSEIIYDNQPGAADDADPVTALGGGSIVIHREK
jgi:hypothetical protein